MGANTVCYVDANNDAGDRVDAGVHVDAGTGIDANIYMLICRQHCQIAAIRHHTLEWLAGGWCHGSWSFVILGQSRPMSGKA